MRGSTSDLPAVLEIDEGRICQADWGDMTVELGKFSATVDPGEFFKGLPDDRCQCPHWGYVLKGRIRYRFADREEVYNAGDAYYAPPGHLPLIEEGTEYVEFSPRHELQKTMEVVARNMSLTGAATD